MEIKTVHLCEKTINEIIVKLSCLYYLKHYR